MITEKLALRIPLLYTLYSRGGIFTVINNYIYGPTILVLYALLFTDIPNIINFVSVIVISYILFALQYEIGYLTNDLISVKTEVGPTIRTQSIYSFKKSAQVIACRLLYIILIYVGVFASNFYVDFFLGIFLCLLIGLSLVYLAHNFLHLISTSLRVITFSLLKISFWFLPSLYALTQFSSEVQKMFVVTFLGAYIFYLHSYTGNKKWHKNLINKYLPKDLELRLILFITFVYIVYYVLISVNIFTLEFIGYIYSYIIFFWILRVILRLIKN